MKKTETILVPFDFSDGAREALRFAQTIAPSLGAEVVLAHVDTMPVVGFPGMTPVAVAALETAEAAHRALADLAESSGHLATAVRWGDPVEQILSLAEETKPRLICMGTHGRRGLARLVIGSVAEKVVRMSPVPVLTVHAPAQQTT